MIAPVLPDNEAARLQTLKRLQILDRPCHENFNRVIRVAKQLFSVPIVAISLIDSDRQWFMSSCGLVVPSTSRDISFCGHNILDEEVMIVGDALADARFCDNPLVLGSPYIGFYVGVPIRFDHHKIASLCIIDHHARTFSKKDESLLVDLGHLVEAELHRIAFEIDESLNAKKSTGQ